MPHNWLDGLKRIPLHLVAFSLPAALAVYYLPLPWGMLTFWAFSIWRLLAELDDWSDHLDTGPKALIDFLSQTVGGPIGGYFYSVYRH